MPNTCNASSAFNAAFEGISLEVQFKTEWKNGTGYFQCDKVDRIPAGERAKTTDDHGRRLILIGTRLGTVVLFQRYSENPDVFVANLPYDMARVFNLSGALTSENIDFITGGSSGYMNIGTRVKDMFAMIADYNEEQEYLAGEIEDGRRTLDLQTPRS